MKENKTYHVYIHCHIIYYVNITNKSIVLFMKIVIFYYILLIIQLFISQ